MSAPLHRALGLSDGEATRIERILGRPPTHLELAMYGVMWSEHCSYKSSRIHLRRLTSEAPQVIVGPGEGAGVVDVGDGIAVAFRIESHNHPSAIEPYQGAATGVGGILRDVFTMGARPIALMDPLRFGPLEDPRSRWVAEGVVSGVSGYGNSVGVPTVGGETVFDETYADNPLVNVFCLGVLPHDRLVLGRASGAGNLAVLLGASTGRDGIGGASVLASAGFGEEADGVDKRPSVQVGDPFEEKRLIEACLALLDSRLVVGVQDLGAAGITGAASETASRGGVGMDLFLSEVHLREAGMEPFEIMTSESQERMLAIVEPADLDDVLAIARRWEVSASVIGTVTGTGRFRVLDRLDGDVLADLPASSLDEDAPLYERPIAAREPTPAVRPPARPRPEDCAEELLELLGDTSWVWSQYDHQLFLNTVVGPGADAAVLRLKHPATGADTGRALALSCDGNHRWCALDPREGTAAVVVESVMNLAVVGARPLGLVDCLNFGNPEHPTVMWEFSEAVDGIGQTCRALGIPVIGGNVSFYNESRGRDIDPTPVVAVVGVVDELREPPPGLALADGHELLVVGGPEPRVDGSAWAWRRGWRTGTPPEVVPAEARDTAALVRSLVAGGRCTGAHDLADGIGVALAEMVVHSGRGAVVDDVGLAGIFGERPAGVLLCVPSETVAEVTDRAAEASVVARVVGRVTGEELVLGSLIRLPVATVADRWAGRIPGALAAGTVQG